MSVGAAVRRAFSEEQESTWITITISITVRLRMMELLVNNGTGAVEVWAADRKDCFSHSDLSHPPPLNAMMNQR